MSFRFFQFLLVPVSLVQFSSVQFLKTHSYLFNINNHAFTDLKNSLGVIYIVRDPRNVVTSWANHNSSSVEDAADYLIGQTEMGDESKVFHGTWGGNYQSWKSFQYQDRYLLIKYESIQVYYLLPR